MNFLSHRDKINLSHCAAFISQLHKLPKKGKVIPITGPVWPRRWVEV